MRSFLLISTLFLSVSAAFAQPVDSLESFPPILPDDPVVARLDALAQEMWLEGDDFTIDTLLLNIFEYPRDSVPSFGEEAYRARLEEIDRRSPMDLRYNNIIRSYIKMYTERKRNLSSRIMGLGELYFPIFEEALDRHNMPLELKYLAVVESALNPTARSRAGASGLWQFMYGTGKEQGLRIDSYVDERLDPIKSTDAACRYLKKLHNIYDDWSLAMAAYNCGPGNVNKAMRRSGARDYWTIYNYLPRETRGYVPAFVAVNYMMNYGAEHNLFPVTPSFRQLEVDTIHICYPVTFAQISKFTGASEEEIRNLNPGYKMGIVPDIDEPTFLTLPRSIVGTYLSNEEAICYHRSKEAVKEAIDPPQKEQITHRVRNGEYLGGIARRYGVSVRSLMSWNGLRSSRIRVGQKLVVHRNANSNTNTAQVTKPKPVTAAPKATPVPLKDGKYEYHTIERGDTLWDIAKKYPGVSVEQLKALNQGVNFKRLYPGKKIKIRTQG